MKIWIVETLICFGDEWEEGKKGYYSSREKAESAIRKYLADYPEEVINTAYEERTEHDIGFLMTLPETEDRWSSKYSVYCLELDEEFGV